MTRLKRHSFTVLYNILGLIFLLVNRIVYALMMDQSFYLYQSFLEDAGLLFFEWLGFILVVVSTIVLISSISKEHRRKS